MKQKYTQETLQTLIINIKRPFLIFLQWDLGAWKTTLSKHILKNFCDVSEEVSSPTYTYYNKYNDNYHFDLYRILDYDEFFAIGGEDILDNNKWVILIEWPEVLWKYYSPDCSITLSQTWIKGEREIEIIYNKKN